MCFQKIEHIVGELRQLVGDRLELLPRGRPRDLGSAIALKAAWTSCQSAGPCPPLRVGTPSSMPVAIILAMSRRHKRDALTHKLERARLCFDVGRQVLELF